MATIEPTTPIHLVARDVYTKAIEEARLGNLQFQKRPSSVQGCSYVGNCGVGASIPVELRAWFDDQGGAPTNIGRILARHADVVTTDNTEALVALQNLHDNFLTTSSPEDVEANTTAFIKFATDWLEAHPATTLNG